MIRAAAARANQTQAGAANQKASSTANEKQKIYNRINQPELGPTTWTLQLGSVHENHFHTRQSRADIEEGLIQGPLGPRAP